MRNNIIEQEPQSEEFCFKKMSLNTAAQCTEKMMVLKTKNC